MAAGLVAGGLPACHTGAAGRRTRRGRAAIASGRTDTMHILRILLAVVLGFLIGSAVNMGLITAGGSLVPPPPGSDLSTMEGLRAAMPAFGASHFVFPFLAHALGTLAGALVASLVAPRGGRVPAAAVGGLFLLGGIANVILLPAPLWFCVLDLTLAYLPMAWLGHAIAGRLRPPGAGVAVGGG